MLLLLLWGRISLFTLFANVDYDVLLLFLLLCLGREGRTVAHRGWIPVSCPVLGTCFFPTLRHHHRLLILKWALKRLRENISLLLSVQKQFHLNKQLINTQPHTPPPMDNGPCTHFNPMTYLVHNEQICLGRPPRSSIQATWWVVNN